MLFGLFCPAPKRKTAYGRATRIEEPPKTFLEQFCVGRVGLTHDMYERLPQDLKSKLLSYNKDPNALCGPNVVLCVEPQYVDEIEIRLLDL